MQWSKESPINVYVVLERRGDGYHEYQPNLLAVYFDESLAREHANERSELDYESVPLAPQIGLIPKEE